MKQKETEATEKEKFEPYYVVEVSGVQKDEEGTDEESGGNECIDPKCICDEGTYRGDGDVEKIFNSGSLFQRKANAYKFLLHILQKYDDGFDYDGLYCFLITGDKEDDFIKVYNYEAGYTQWLEEDFLSIVEECKYLDSL